MTGASRIIPDVRTVYRQVKAGARGAVRPSADRRSTPRPAGRSIINRQRRAVGGSGRTMNSAARGNDDHADPARAENLSEFLNVLSRMRIARGQTYKELERLTGIPGSTLCDTLTGKRRPRRDVVDKVVRAYARNDAQAGRWMKTWALLSAAEAPGSQESALDETPPPAPRRSPWRGRPVVIWSALAVIVVAAIGIGIVATSSGAGAHGGARGGARGAARQGWNPTVQAQIDRQLLQLPGGDQINAHEVSYGEGKFVIGAGEPGYRDAAAADCPTGWICFYSHKDFGWPRARLAACGWSDLGWWDWNDRIESVRNNTGSAVRFINHDDHFNPANRHRFDRTLFSVGPHQALAVVPGTATPPDQADHVSRGCAK
ncbi:peptidase inhibitor family I36 protein [Actinomadura barringtoniae]|uniref:Peptidase inhibitor family I36 protein n=1 Tax=Actinomadura barringtoniae TaxID=1427535 RepID=A0A939TG39_9ACTN|nr:peptidase inhibitor family I36 protein [Actinomadura barringtoniae]MBO2455035.1 peptidase inhibitor family I36 protein [Actinomadura barringtoniae]